MINQEKYDNGNYTGEFLNGERHGKGTYCWNNGKRYEGNWNNGEMHGEGTFYFPDGTRFEGFFENNGKDFRGTIFYPNGDTSSGTRINNKNEGVFVSYDKKSGDKIETTFKNGLRDGKTIVTNGKYRAEYIYKADKKHGEYTIIYEDGVTEFGNYKNDKKEGDTKIIACDTTLEARYKNGVLDGNAIYKWASGDWQKRKYKNDKICSIMYGMKENGAIIAGRRHEEMSYSAVIFEGSTYIGYAIDKGDTTGKNGRGTIYNADGTIEYGEWKNSKLVLRLHNPMLSLENYDANNYQGEIINNLFNGNGIYTYPSGDKYEGEWTDGKRHGNGKITFTNGDMFEGKFVDDFPSGFGSFYYHTGDKYYGGFLNGLRQGHGKFIFNTGDIYDGNFNKDNFEGMGTLTFVDGEKYIGEFKNWGFNGYGTYVYNNGDIYFGQFVNCCKSGEGVLYTNEGQMMGIWDANKLVQKKFPLGNGFMQLYEKNQVVQEFLKKDYYGKLYIGLAKKEKNNNRSKYIYQGALHGSKKALEMLYKAKDKYSTFYYAKYVEEMGYNIEEVVNAYEKAIKNKSIYAMMKLAEMYEKGEVVPKDKQKAKDLYQKASKYKTKDTLESIETSKARLALSSIDEGSDGEYDFVGFVSPMTGMSVTTKETKVE